MQAVRAHQSPRPLYTLSKARACRHIQLQQPADHPSSVAVLAPSSYTVSPLAPAAAAIASPSAVPPKPSRANMQTCQAGWHLPGAVEGQLQKVQGPRVFFVCLMLAVVGGVLFHNLESQIAAAVGAAFRNSSLAVNIRPLDVQGLYSPTSLAYTFAAWGPRGRAAFAAYEFVDLGLFLAAYSGLFLVALNWTRSRQEEQQQQGDLVGPESLVRLGYLLVVMLLVTDFCENLLQLLLSDTFKLDPSAAAAAGTAADVEVLLRNCTQPLWRRAVAVVCAGVHVTKWLLLYLNLAVVGVGAAHTLLGKVKSE